VRGASSAQTLVLLDGVVLNDPVLGAFDWSTPATAGLERVEVARGPFSALWGSAAMGGVVQLVTRAPGGRELGARLEAGSNDLAHVALGAGAPFGRFALDVAGDLRRGDGELDNDLFDADQGQLRLDARPVEGLRVGLIGRTGDAETGLPYDFFGAPSPRRRQRSESRLVALPVDWSRGDWSLEAHAARTESRLELEDAGDPFAANDNDTEREQARVELAWTPSAALSLAGGLERGREVASSSSAFGAGLDRARQTTDAAFAEVGWRARRFRFDVGARRDEHSEFGSATSLRGGAVVDLGAGLRLRAGYGESFRAPSLGDLYFPGFGNPRLAPERGESAELGLEADAGALNARVTAFRTDFEELIQFSFASFLPENIGRARAEGVEGSLAARGRLWRGLLHATWLAASDLDSDRPLPRRPEWSAALVADRAAERWSAGATVRYTGDREDVGGVPLDAFAVVDLRASWTARPWLAPFARVENLLDERYEEAIGFPAPGRGFALGVTLRSPR
jgi:vitamin B12 transporter